MEALNVANYIIDNWSDKFEITNLKLNKLVYYSQVESLRKYNRPLFDDIVEAWQYGPVEPVVYHTFSSYGRNCITKSSDLAILDGTSKKLIDSVMDKLGMLTAIWSPCRISQMGHGRAYIRRTGITPSLRRQFLRLMMV